MIILAATAFWLFTAFILARLIKIDRSSVAASRTSWALRFALMIVSIFIFFRPHEEIRSGQDPGVYINTAGAIANHGALFFTDEMLEQVPVKDRSVFFLGHLEGYNLTKDSCLHVKDLETAQIGPRFPVLYPIAMSLAIHLSGARLALYVVPLFAVLTGYALCVLAGFVFRRSEAGPLAFLFYTCMPHVVWHARAARPEIIASFFCLAGLVLLLHAASSASRTAVGNVLYAALAVALAPFLHVTAWFVAIAMIVPVGILLLSARRDFLVYPAVAVAGVLAYVHQTVTVADQYNLAPKLKPLLEGRLPFVIIGTSLALPIIVYVIGCLLRKRRVWSSLSTRFTPSRLLSLRASMALAFIVLCAYLYLRTDPVNGRSFDGYAYHYFYPTDLRLLRVYLSRSVCLLGGFGLILMILSKTRTQAHLTVLIVLLPNALLMGNVHDFFMTRYFLLAACPLIVLGLSKTITTLPLPAMVRPISTSLLAIGVCILLLNRRTTMVTTTEYKGLTAFIQEFADEVTRENGIMLAEYTRLATPFEHLHGIPLLSLDNETRVDYRPAMDAWESIMAENPSRTAFFLTPFGTPVSDRFEFEPVRSETLVYDSLDAGRNQLPMSKTSRSLSLSLYHMQRNKDSLPPQHYIRGFDGSNMGLRRFVRHNRHVDTKEWSIDGHLLRAGEVGRINFESDVSVGNASQLIIFAIQDGIGTPNVSSLTNDGNFKLAWRHVFNQWWIGKMTGDKNSRVNGLDMLPSEHLLVTDVHHISGDRARRILTVPNENGLRLMTFTGRWARSPSRLLAPLPSAESGFVCLLLNAPDDTGQRAKVRIGTRDASLGSRTVETGKWTWELWPVGKGQTSGTQWLKLQVDPTWDPALKGYPDDLALRIGCIASLPVK
jgi:hypothetical protein